MCLFVMLTFFTKFRFYLKHHSENHTAKMGNFLRFLLQRFWVFGLRVSFHWKRCADIYGFALVSAYSFRLQRISGLSGKNFWANEKKNSLFFCCRTKEINSQKFRDLILKFSFNIKLYIPNLINWCHYFLFIMKFLICYLTLNFTLLSFTQKPVNWFALQQQTDFLSARRQCKVKDSSGKWTIMKKIKCKTQKFLKIKKSWNP